MYNYKDYLLCVYITGNDSIMLELSVPEAHRVISYEATICFINEMLSKDKISYMAAQGTL